MPRCPALRKHCPRAHRLGGPLSGGSPSVARPAWMASARAEPPSGHRCRNTPVPEGPVDSSSRHYPSARRRSNNVGAGNASRSSKPRCDVWGNCVHGQRPVCGGLPTGGSFATSSQPSWTPPFGSKKLPHLGGESDQQAEGPLSWFRQGGELAALVCRSTCHVFRSRCRHAAFPLCSAFFVVSKLHNIVAPTWFQLA